MEPIPPLLADLADLAAKNLDPALVANVLAELVHYVEIQYVRCGAPSQTEN